MWCLMEQWLTNTSSTALTALSFLWRNSSSWTTKIHTRQHSQLWSREEEVNNNHTAVKHNWMSVRDYIYLKTLNFRSVSHIFRYIIFKIVLAFQHLIKVRVLNKIIFWRRQFLTTFYFVTPILYFSFSLCTARPLNSVQKSWKHIRIYINMNFLCNNVSNS